MKILVVEDEVLLANSLKTLLEGKGGWSGQEKEVLLCAFKQRQIVELKALVKGIDPDAFLIVCDAYEVLGDGFRAYQKNEI